LSKGYDGGHSIAWVYSILEIETGFTDVVSMKWKKDSGMIFRCLILITGE
jgi:hypothetical protein